MRDSCTPARPTRLVSVDLVGDEREVIMDEVRFGVLRSYWNSRSAELFQGRYLYTPSVPRGVGIW